MTEKKGPQKVRCHTDIPVGDPLDLDLDLSNGDRLSVDALLADLPASGTGSPEAFFRRLGGAGGGRRSWSADPHQIHKASRQLELAMREAFSTNTGRRVKATPFDFWSVSRLLMSNTWHARCVELVSKVAAGLDWMLDKRSIEDEPSSADIAAIDALLRRPSDPEEASDQTVQINDVAQCVFHDLRSLGNANLEIVRDGFGRPVEIYHVPAVTVRVDAQGRGFWQVGHGGLSETSAATTRTRFFKNYGDRRDIGSESGPDKPRREGEPLASEMVHLKTYHPLGGAYGVPAFLPAVLAIRVNRASDDYNADFFEHNTVPNKIIVFHGLIPDERTKQTIADYFEVGLKGRIHKPLVLSVDEIEDGQKIEIRDLTAFQAIDGGFLRLKDMSRDEILAAHGVPGSMVGVRSPGRLGGKGDNETSRRDFKALEIEPLQVGFERVINMLVIEDGFGVNDVVFRLANFDLSDHDFALAKSKEMRSQVGVAIRTINEARKELGLDPFPFPQADAPFVQTSAGPLYLQWIDLENPPAALLAAGGEPDTNGNDEDESDVEDRLSALEGEADAA